MLGIKNVSINGTIKVLLQNEAYQRLILWGCLRVVGPPIDAGAEERGFDPIYEILPTDILRLRQLTPALPVEYPIHTSTRYESF